MSKLSDLPKSLREAVNQVKKSGSGGSFAVFRRPSRWMEPQGTRAPQDRGTMSSGNTPNPLQPGQTVTPDRPRAWDDQTNTPVQAEFSTVKEVREGAPGTIVQTRDWPPNPSYESITPPDRYYREAAMLDGELHMGPGPGRILRHMPIRVFGIVSAPTGQRGTEASYDGNTASHDYLAHRDVARQALGVKGPQKLSDDNAVIPAIYAGNPRG